MYIFTRIVFVVVFLSDDPSYSPEEGGDGVILYAPFIRARWVTYKTQNINIFVFLIQVAYIGNKNEHVEDVFL